MSLLISTMSANWDFPIDVDLILQLKRLIHRRSQ